MLINQQIKTLRGLWFLIERRQKIYCLCVVILMIVASLAEALSIGSLVPFLTILSNPQKITEIPFLVWIYDILNLKISATSLTMVVTFIFISAVIIAALIRLLLLWAVITLSFLIGSSLSTRMFQIAMHQDYETHLSENSSTLISGITVKVDSIIFGAFMPCMLLLSSFGMLLAIIGMLLFFSAGLTILIFGVFVLIYITVIFSVKNKIIRQSREISQGSENVIKVLQEAFGGIRDVIVGGYQKYYVELYKKENINLKKSQGNCNFIGQSPRYFIEALGVASIALAAYLLSKKDEGLLDLLPMLGAIAFGAQKLLPILQQGYAAFVSLQSNQASLNDALLLLERPAIIVYGNSSSLSDKKFLKEIKFNAVSFCYRNAKNNILSDVDLVIPRGSRVGIIGPSGGGKSTFLDLLLGLLEPTSGSITIDGEIINSGNDSWRRLISHVPQHVFLIDGTILENIALGVPENLVDVNRLNRSLELAQLSSFVNGIYKGCKAEIGENGGKLSGGQRQRVGIARALYMNKKVLIMDEATSALDSNTEMEIMNSLYALDAQITLIIVSHKISALSRCDVIFEIDGGIIRKKDFSEIIKNEIWNT